MKEDTTARDLMERDINLAMKAYRQATAVVNTMIKNPAEPPEAVGAAAIEAQAAYTKLLQLRQLRRTLRLA